MKFLLWFLLLAAPLAAQTTTAPTLVFKIVVTTVPSTSTTTPPPVGDPGSPGDTGPPSTGDPGHPGDPGGPTGPPTTTPPLGCVSFYTGAITALNGVYTNLLRAQQLYASAYAAGGIDATTYNSKLNSLVAMQLYSQDARDIIRIGGPADVIGQTVNAVSTEVATLPTLLANVPLMAAPLPPLVADIQAGLTNATNLVNTSSCAQSNP